MSLMRLPTPLRPYVENQKEVEVAGPTVAAALDELGERFPDLRNHLFDETGQLRPYIHLFLNETDIRSLQGIETPIEERDRLMIVPSIAGGRPGVNP